jgi:hypothetical protein
VFVATINTASKDVLMMVLDGSHVVFVEHQPVSPSILLRMVPKGFLLKDSALTDSIWVEIPMLGAWLRHRSHQSKMSHWFSSRTASITGDFCISSTVQYSHRPLCSTSQAFSMLGGIISVMGHLYSEAT